MSPVGLTQSYSDKRHKDKNYAFFSVFWFCKRKDFKDEDQLVGLVNARVANFPTSDKKQHTAGKLFCFSYTLEERSHSPAHEHDCRFARGKQKGRLRCTTISS